MKKVLLALMMGAGVAMLAVPAASAHAVVSPYMPQGSALTGARTAYVLRVPNERTNRATYKVTMNVPQAVQTAISVLYMPGWNIKLTRVDTGARTAEGAPIMATTSVTWTAKKGMQIMPGFYTELFFRFQNPLTPTKLCFPTLQYYGGTLNAKGLAKGAGELVSWTGDASSATPASCVDIVSGK
jgi:uncharacterized protein YcnI